MDTIEQLLVDILAVRDCEATRKLCLDVWGYSQQRGEEEGLKLGRVILDGVREYVAHERSLRTSIAGGLNRERRTD